MRQAVRKPASTTIRLMRVPVMIFPRVPSHPPNAQMRGWFRVSSKQGSPGGEYETTEAYATPTGGTKGMAYFAASAESMAKARRAARLFGYISCALCSAVPRSIRAVSAKRK
jgi:hypothetical protein